MRFDLAISYKMCTLMGLTHVDTHERKNPDPNRKPGHVGL